MAVDDDTLLAADSRMEAVIFGEHLRKTQNEVVHFQKGRGRQQFTLGASGGGPGANVV